MIIAVSSLNALIVQDIWKGASWGGHWKALQDEDACWFGDEVDEEEGGRRKNGSKPIDKQKYQCFFRWEFVFFFAEM